MREALRAAKERLWHKVRGPRAQTARDGRNRRQERELWSDEQPAEEIRVERAED